MPMLMAGERTAQANEPSNNRSDTESRRGANCKGYATKRNFRSLGSGERLLELVNPGSCFFAKRDKCG
jgi:hypothetical protein